MSEGGASPPGGEADGSRDAAATLGGLEYLLPFAAAAASGVAREEWKHFRLARRADFEVRVIDGDWEAEGARRYRWTLEIANNTPSGAKIVDWDTTHASGGAFYRDAPGSGMERRSDGPSLQPLDPFLARESETKLYFRAAIDDTPGRPAKKFVKLVLSVFPFDRDGPRDVPCTLAIL